MDISDILSELGENGFTDTGLATKLNKIQATIWEIEGHKPWPFLEASINLNFAGSTDVASNLPSDFRASLRLKDLSTGRRVMPVRLDDFEDFVGTDHDRSGDPSIYYFEGGQLKVWPLPAAGNARLKLRYIRWSPEIDADTVEADILIPKQYHEAIIYGALHRLYLQEDDAELAAGFKALYDERLARMEEVLLQQQFDRPDHVHVLDEDDWDYDDLYL